MYDIGVFKSTIPVDSCYKLPENIISNIDLLHKLLGVNNIIDNASRKHHRDNTDNWKTKEVFKATPVTKLEGIDQIIGDIKKHMNKLTLKNFDNNLNEITDLTDTLLETNSDSIHQLIDILVSVSCNNKYYSNLYAKIYMTMIDKHDCFTVGKTNIINDYLEELKKISIVDPTVDYDKFCDSNKMNERRRGRLLFIIHLYKENGYDNNDILRIINEINQQINDKRTDKIHTELINELAEDVNIFVTNMVEQIKTDNDFTFILDTVRSYSTCNLKEYLGISNRVKFKHMDMMDLFK
tara:strand:- start:19 stop:903 length:885 start_codon:yes stop_codon:yes gene_type:complete